MILYILHAHVRAETIVSFALPCTFSIFAELEFYFSTYWRELICQDNVRVGHPSVNLQYVDYRHYFGLPHCVPEENRDLMFDICNSLEPYDEYLSRFFLLRKIMPSYTLSPTTGATPTLTLAITTVYVVTVTLQIPSPLMDFAV